MKDFRSHRAEWVTPVSTSYRGYDVWELPPNGQGIAAESHQAIFEIFRRLGRRPVGGHGAGIGLAIVRKIAESHGGRVWVESESGKGAAFHVLFPR